MRLFKHEAPWFDYIVGHEDGKAVLAEDTPEEYKKMYEEHKKKVLDFRLNGYKNARKRTESKKI